MSLRAPGITSLGLRGVGVEIIFEGLSVLRRQGPVHVLEDDMSLKVCGPCTLILWIPILSRNLKTLLGFISSLRVGCLRADVVAESLGAL